MCGDNFKKQPSKQYETNARQKSGEIVLKR